MTDVNKPYRGWKLTMFEGGLRVPYVAKCPGHIAPGTRYHAPITNIDIMPTIVAAAGGSLPKDRTIDGVNLLPYLGANQTRQPDRFLFWRDGPYRAMRDGTWKVIVSDRPRKDWLFNLVDDPTERTNLASAQPQRLAQLKAVMDAHHATMPPAMWPSFIEMPIEIDKPLNDKHLPTDEYVYWYN